MFNSFAKMLIWFYTSKFDSKSLIWLINCSIQHLFKVLWTKKFFNLSGKSTFHLSIRLPVFLVTFPVVSHGKENLRQKKNKLTKNLILVWLFELFIKKEEKQFL